MDNYTKLKLHRYYKFTSNKYVNQIFLYCRNRRVVVSIPNNSMAKRLQQQKQYQLQQQQQKQLQLKQQQLQRLQKNQLKRRFAASSQSQQQQGVSQESHNLIEQAFQTANEVFWLFLNNFYYMLKRNGLLVQAIFE